MGGSVLAAICCQERVDSTIRAATAESTHAQQCRAWQKALWRNGGLAVVATPRAMKRLHQIIIFLSWG